MVEVDDELSEPRFPARDVGRLELGVSLGEIEDALDQADDARNRTSEATGGHRDQKHDDPLFLVTQIKFVDSKRP